MIMLKSKNDCAGMYLEEASAPLIIEQKGVPIALFDCCFMGIKPLWFSAASAKNAGIDNKAVCKKRYLKSGLIDDKMLQ